MPFLKPSAGHRNLLPAGRRNEALDSPGWARGVVSQLICPTTTMYTPSAENVSVAWLRAAVAMSFLVGRS
jgi:hypothetical protein